jgi:hypothetical protein
MTDDQFRIVVRYLRWMVVLQAIIAFVIVAETVWVYFLNG